MGFSIQVFEKKETDGHQLQVVSFLPKKKKKLQVVSKIVRILEVAQIDWFWVFGQRVHLKSIEKISSGDDDLDPRTAAIQIIHLK